MTGFNRMKEESRLIFISGDQKKYKEYRITRLKLLTVVGIILFVVFGLGKFGLDFLIDFTHDSKIEKQERTIAVLESRLIDFQTKFNFLADKVKNIGSKDDELRTVLGLSEVSADERNVGIGGANFEEADVDEISGFVNYDLNNQIQELYKLERQIQFEENSFKELAATFKHKQDSIDYLPALKPVLKGVISSKFGYRNHPILKIKRHHDGVDISARRGEPVYASADGTVRFSGRMGTLGLMIMIDHKYGFSTRFGHLDRVVIRPGQAVKRGEKIGEVGNSGLSTSPHLHYEVHYQDKPVDPLKYIFDDYKLTEQIVLNSN